MSYKNFSNQVEANKYYVVSADNVKTTILCFILCYLFRI